MALKRIDTLETLRGLACVLLVFFHVVGSNANSGLRLPAEHPLRLINFVFYDLRMPIFSFISGFVFLVVATDLPALKGSVAKKIRRLLLPMCVACLVTYAFHAAIFGEDESFWSIFLFPYEQYWYIQATFVLMLIFLSVSFIFGDNTLRQAIVLIALGKLTYILFYDDLPRFFSLYQAAYLAPYFFLGYIIAHRYRAWVIMPRADDRLPLAPGLTLLAIGMLYYQFNVRTGTLEVIPEVDRLGRVTCGVLVCFALLAWKFRSTFLVAIGQFSYVIFLYHVFFTASARIMATKVLSIADPYILTLFGLVIGLGGPIIMQKVVLRYRYLALIVLGIPQKDKRDYSLKVTTA